MIFLAYLMPIVTLTFLIIYFVRNIKNENSLFYDSPKYSSKFPFCNAIRKQKLTKHTLPNFANTFNNKNNHIKYKQFLSSNLMNEIVNLNESESQYNG